MSTQHDLLATAIQVGAAIRAAREKLDRLDVADRRQVLRTVASLLGLPPDSLLGIAPEGHGRG